MADDLLHHCRKSGGLVLEWDDRKLLVPAVDYNGCMRPLVQIDTDIYKSFFSVLHLSFPLVLSGLKKKNVGIVCLAFTRHTAHVH
ncbi:hypothetical protein D3C80_2089520 [compost metagenome]